MNEDQLAQLSQWVNSYFVLVWILAGVALGAIVCWILELILVSRKQKTNKDTTTTISSARLKTIHKEIKEYRSAKNELDDFFKDIQEDKPKE